MLFSMLFPTFIAAIFYEITAITFLQFDVINFRDAAVCAHFVVVVSSCAVHYFIIGRPMVILFFVVVSIDRVLLDDGTKRRKRNDLNCIGSQQKQAMTKSLLSFRILPCCFLCCFLFNPLPFNLLSCCFHCCFSFDLLLFKLLPCCFPRCFFCCFLFGPTGAPHCTV